MTKLITITCVIAAAAGLLYISDHPAVTSAVTYAMKPAPVETETKIVCSEFTGACFERQVPKSPSGWYCNGKPIKDQLHCPPSSTLSKSGY
jgi:hypothetical protein